MKIFKAWGTALCALLLWPLMACAAVVYMGPEGTFSEEAAYSWFQGSGQEMVMKADVPSCLEDLESGAAEFAVIPLENTIGGLAGSGRLYMDSFLAHQDLRIVGQIDVAVRQMLMGVEGTTLETIKTVWSHPQGLTQGRAWMEENLPNVTVEPTATTAEGARLAAEKQDTSIAAIAAPRAAEVYGLEIVAPDIQITQTNVTRFWVVCKAEKAADVKLNRGLTRTSLAVTGLTAKLPALLSAMEESGLTLAAIHERPLGTNLGDYRWVLEFLDNGGNQERIEAAIAALPELEVRYLGTYNCK